MGTCAHHKEENNVARKINKNAIIAMRRRQSLQEIRDRDCVFETFDQFDSDNDGYLNMPEVVNFVKHSYKKKGKDCPLTSQDFFQERAEKLIDKVDLNGDKRISREDFYYFYKKC